MGHEIKQEKLKLYLRVPFKVREDKRIYALHPAIKKILIPRQPSAKWCHLIFEDEESCVKVREALVGQKIDGKKIFVNFSRKPRNTRQAALEELEAKEEIKEEESAEMVAEGEDFIGNPIKVEYGTDDELEYEDGGDDDGPFMRPTVLFYGGEEDEIDDFDTWYPIEDPGGVSIDFLFEDDNDLLEEDDDDYEDEPDDDYDEDADEDFDELRLNFVNGQYVEVGATLPPMDATDTADSAPNDGADKNTPASVEDAGTSSAAEQPDPDTLTWQDA